MLFLSVCVASASTVMLAACGGGGGGDGDAAPAPAPSPAPPAGSITISGVARYESVQHNPANGALNYAGTTAKPIRGAVVEVVSSPGGAVLATTSTDANGNYFAFVPASAGSILVRVKAKLLQAGAPSWDFQVRDNTAGDALYVLDSAAFSPNGASTAQSPLAGSGWTGSGYGQPRAAGPFAVLDTVYASLTRTLAVAPMQAWPPLNLYWSVNNNSASAGNPAVGNIGTSFYTQSNTGVRHRIFILGKADEDTDEYDPHVVAHEWGHYMQVAVSRNDSIGGPHAGRDRLDMRVAFGEGFGNAWSGIVLGDPVYRDSLGAQQGAGFTNNVSQPDTSPGWFRERTLQYVIYTLDQQLGLGPLWQGFTGPLRTAPAAVAAHSLAAAIKTVAPASAATVNSLFASQSIAATDMFGTGETNSGSVPDTLPVYKTYGALGSALPLCVTDAGGGWPNKHGFFAYARVSLPTTRAYTVRVAGGTDPDFRLFNGNVLHDAEGIDPAQETLVVNLAAGDYVVAASDFQLSGRMCLTLTIN